VVQAASAAHLVLLPVEPHLFSLETIIKQAALLRAAHDPAAIYLINKAPVQGTEAAGAAKYISEEGFTVCPTYLHLRAVHRHAANLGQGATEFAPGSKASQEVLKLYEYMIQNLNHNRS